MLTCSGVLVDFDFVIRMFTCRPVSPGAAEAVLVPALGRAGVEEDAAACGVVCVGSNVIDMLFPCNNIVHICTTYTYIYNNTHVPRRHQGWSSGTSARGRFSCRHVVLGDAPSVGAGVDRVGIAHTHTNKALTAASSASNGTPSIATRPKRDSNPSCPCPFPFPSSTSDVGMSVFPSPSPSCSASSRAVPGRQLLLGCAGTGGGGSAVVGVVSGGRACICCGVLDAGCHQSQIYNHIYPTIN